jgi:hypothetical protein
MAADPVTDAESDAMNGDGGLPQARRPDHRLTADT